MEYNTVDVKVIVVYTPEDEEYSLSTYALCIKFAEYFLDSYGLQGIEEMVNDVVSERFDEEDIETLVIQLPEEWEDNILEDTTVPKLDEPYIAGATLREYIDRAEEVLDMKPLLVDDIDEDILVMYATILDYRLLNY